jgi:S1-C subfamily serine protease
LQSLSNDLATAVEVGAASVVRVEARPRLAASGFVWTDGVVVTADHVVEYESPRLGLPDGTSVESVLVGRDPATDLAVLRTQATGLVTAIPADSAGLRVGHLVLALGRPGNSIMASLGIICALGGEWRSPAGGLIDRFVQTSITMYPGFSGGPLVDIQGHVIGLNTSGLLRGMQPTIPVSTVGQVITTLLEHGRMRRGYLGISTQPVRLPGSLAQSLNQETGLLIIGVETDSPAGRAGLMLGDTLIALAGQTIRQMDDLMYVLSGDRIGTLVTARVIRGGEPKDIPVVIGERA